MPVDTLLGYQSDGLGGSWFQPLQACILASLAEQVFILASVGAVE